MLSTLAALALAATLAHGATMMVRVVPGGAGLAPIHTPTR